MDTRAPTIPEEKAESLAAEEQARGGLSESGLRPIAGTTEELEQPPEVPELRLAMAMAFSILAASVMLGGIFTGVVRPRFWAALAGVVGILIALAAHRLRRPALVNVTVVLGILFVGLLVVLPTGLGNVIDIGRLARRAAASGDVLRPPVEFTPGWRAIVGWLMAALGFAAAWIAIEVRRPSLGLLVAMPVVAITAISVAHSAQVPSGIVSLVFFAVSLGVLSGAQSASDDQRLSMGYELRRAAKAVPMIGVITTALILLTQTDFLFPKPLYDPTQEAKKPQTVPLSEVKDRVLFRVKAGITGPWRMGSLDVYDKSDGTWRLPPFAQSRLKAVPRSGVLDSELTPGIIATFRIADLGGAVLPGLPNMVGLVAEGPKLSFDHRNGNIRLAQGTIEPGLEYRVVAAIVPNVDQLKDLKKPIPDDVQQFLQIPELPPGVKSLLGQAPTSSAWERLDFLRTTLLKTVTSKGAGVPVPVPPSKVDDMLFGSKEGTPFQIVAAQAMLARWAGVPSRIGYGFDGGERAGDLLEVRPKHGASFLEVYFPGYKWLPVIGTPLQAQTSIGNDPQQFNPNVIASNEVAVKVYLPIALNPQGYLFDQVQRALVIVLPIILVLLLGYYGWPAVRKAWIRSRRRAWAMREGPVARIAVAYAEFRDLASDFGHRYETDTPLMFLDRVVEDDEHLELAWLVTRCLWGDLQDRVSARDAVAALELARSLEKRMRQSQSVTLRTIAAVSRISLRHPYAPSLGPRMIKERTGAIQAA